jgi:predicted DNA-binding ribbon-helix-helix protein
MTVKKSSDNNNDKENGGDPPTSEPAERSLTVAGQRTGVRLDDALWNELRAMADERNVSVSELVNSIDIKRKRGNLSAAIRQFLSNYRRRRR